MICKCLSAILLINCEQSFFLVFPAQVMSGYSQILFPFSISFCIGKCILNGCSNRFRVVIINENANIISSDNLFYFSQMRCDNRHACLNEIEKLVGQTETVIQVGILIQAETQLRILRISHLMIIGGGDVLPILKQMVVDLNIADRVRFLPRMSYAKMMAYTQNAELGFCLDKDTNLNYRFSLPNKLFDFIQAGVPIVASHLTEIEKIIRRYDIGVFIENHDPKTIAATIQDALSDAERYGKWKQNLAVAAQDLRWENEEKVLLAIYQQYG